MISPRLQSLPGTHTPDLTYVKQGQEWAKSQTRATNTPSQVLDPTQTVSEYLEGKLRAFRASCYLSDLTCLRLARIALCREVRRETGLVLLYRSACKLLTLS